MNKKLPAVVFICTLSILILTYILYVRHHDSKITISKVTDIEKILVDHNISISSVSDIQYCMLSDKSTLIIDSRNDGGKMYTHSDVSADMNADGTLNVIVTDRAAVSESDLTQKYAIIIESQDKIINITIKVVSEGL